MLIRILIGLTLMTIAGCSKDAIPELEGGWAPPGACVFVGNRVNHHSCATTGTQLLANPQIYDGHRISLRAWAIVGRHDPNKPAVWLYLTQDNFELGARQSAVILEGPALSEIVELLEGSGAQTMPRQLGLTGDFEVFKPDTLGERRKHTDECCMFGRIRNIEEWAP